MSIFPESAVNFECASQTRSGKIDSLPAKYRYSFNRGKVSVDPVLAIKIVENGQPVSLAIAARG
jgi:hypothetical protein